MKTRIIFTIALFVFTITAIQAKDIKSITLKVEEMMCEIHEGQITNMLRFEKGVKEIKTDVPTRQVIIKYDAEKTTPDKLVKSFKKVNCTAVIIGDTIKKGTK